MGEKRIYSWLRTCWKQNRNKSLITCVHLQKYFRLYDISYETKYQRTNKDHPLENINLYKS